MPQFNIEIIETLVKIVKVEAQDVDTAISNVRQSYRNEEIVLDADNHLATEIQLYLDCYDEDE